MTSESALPACGLSSLVLLCLSSTGATQQASESPKLSFVLRKQKGSATDSRTLNERGLGGIELGIRSVEFALDAVARSRGELDCLETFGFGALGVLESLAGIGVDGHGTHLLPPEVSLRGRGANGSQGSPYVRCRTNVRSSVTMDGWLEGWDVDVGCRCATDLWPPRGSFPCGDRAFATAGSKDRRTTLARGPASSSSGDATRRAASGPPSWSTWSRRVPTPQPCRRGSPRDSFVRHPRPESPSEARRGLPDRSLRLAASAQTTMWGPGAVRRRASGAVRRGCPS